LSNIRGFYLFNVARAQPYPGHIDLRAGRAQFFHELFLDEVKLLHPRTMIHAHEQGAVFELGGVSSLRDLRADDVAPALDELALVESFLEAEIAQNRWENISDSSEGTSRHTVRKVLGLCSGINLLFRGAAVISNCENDGYNDNQVVNKQP